MKNVSKRMGLLDNLVPVSQNKTFVAANKKDQADFLVSLETCELSSMEELERR